MSKQMWKVWVPRKQAGNVCLICFEEQSCRMGNSCSNLNLEGFKILHEFSQIFSKFSYPLKNVSDTNDPRPPFTVRDNRKNVYGIKFRLSFIRHCM